MCIYVFPIKYSIEKVRTQYPAKYCKSLQTLRHECILQSKTLSMPHLASPVYGIESGKTPKDDLDRVHKKQRCTRRNP